MALPIGHIAPDFTLPDNDKQQVTLSTQKGKNVLLLFFPFAFTGTCTAELCQVRDNLKMFENLDALVYGISVDSPFSLNKFKEEQSLNFPLLSDFNKEVSTAYESIYEIFALGMKGVSKRSAYIIDKEGFIKYAEVLEVPTEIPNFIAIENCLKELNK